MDETSLKEKKPWHKPQLTMLERSSPDDQRFTACLPTDSGRKNSYTVAMVMAAVKNQQNANAAMQQAALYLPAQ